MIHLGNTMVPEIHAQCLHLPPPVLTRGAGRKRKEQPLRDLQTRGVCKPIIQPYRGIHPPTHPPTHSFKRIAGRQQGHLTYPYQQSSPQVCQPPPPTSSLPETRRQGGKG